MIYPTKQEWDKMPSSAKICLIDAVLCNECVKHDCYEGKSCPYDSYDVKWILWNNLRDNLKDEKE